MNIELYHCVKNNPGQTVLLDIYPHAPYIYIIIIYGLYSINATNAMLTTYILTNACDSKNFIRQNIHRLTIFLETILELKCPYSSTDTDLYNLLFLLKHKALQYITLHDKFHIVLLFLEEYFLERRIDC